MTNIVDFTKKLQERQTPNEQDSEETGRTYEPSDTFKLPNTHLILDIHDQMRMIDDRVALMIAAGGEEALSVINLARLMTVAKSLMHGMILPFAGQKVSVLEKPSNSGGPDWMVNLFRRDPVNMAGNVGEGKPLQKDFDIDIYYDEFDDPTLADGRNYVLSKYSMEYLPKMENSEFRPRVGVPAILNRLTDLVRVNGGTVGPIPDTEETIILTVLPFAKQCIFIVLKAYGLKATKKEDPTPEAPQAI